MLKFRTFFDDIFIVYFLVITFQTVLFEFHNKKMDFVFFTGRKPPPRRDRRSPPPRWEPPRYNRYNDRGDRGDRGGRYFPDQRQRYYF